MTDLIESLLEFSRTRESLRPSYGDVRSAVDRAVQGVKAHPEFQRIRIRIVVEGSTEGWFDFKKLERALLNLLLNACEVVPLESGKIDIELKRRGENLEIRIADNGPGIAEAVRDRLFDPFVSHGKENGTGMGLTVVQKIAAGSRGRCRGREDFGFGNRFPSEYPSESVSGECSGSPSCELDLVSLERAQLHRLRKNAASGGIGKGTTLVVPLSRWK